MTTTLDETVDPREANRLCMRSVEFRQNDDPTDDGFTLEGHGAVFGVTTEIESYSGGFDEELMPGCFKKTLKERHPVMQFNHGRDKRAGAVPIAAIKDLRECAGGTHGDDDTGGLFVGARMFDNDVVKPVRQAIAGRAIRGMSIKFRVVRDRWLDEDGNELDEEQRRKAMRNEEKLHRQILEVELFELGPVVFPAFVTTDVGVRSTFDPDGIAVRGVIAQFGLDEGCIRQHLSVFDADARQALATEIASSFPELADVLADANAAPLDAATVDANERARTVAMLIRDGFTPDDALDSVLNAEIVAPAEELTAVGSHGGVGKEGTWDADANQKRLPDPVPLATAKAFYAWYDASKVTDGAIPKSAGKLPHHFVSEDGKPGAASLSGVNNALARLNQTQGITAEERGRVEAHLRNHQPKQSSSDAADGTSEAGAAHEGTPRHADAVRSDTSAIPRQTPEWWLPGSADEEEEGQL